MRTQKVVSQSLSSNPKQLDKYSLEDTLARELQMRKFEEENQRLYRQRVCEESEEIQSLKKKLQMAYVNKERTQQILECQKRKLNDLVRNQYESAIEANVLTRRMHEQQQQNQVENYQRQQRINGRRMLESQMVEKLNLLEESKKQHQQEKQGVDQIIQKLINEDKRNFEHQQHKKNQIKKDMEEAYQDRQEKIRREREFERKENQEFLRYIQSKDQQENEWKQKRNDELAQKDKIFQRLVQEEEQRKQQEQLENDLRFELNQEQYEAQNKEFQYQELLKRQKIKEEYQMAEQEAKYKKQKEREIQNQLKDKQKDEYLNQLRLAEEEEQEKQIRRRQIALANQDEVLRLRDQQKYLYELEIQKEKQEMQRKQEEERLKNEIIEQERQRLLREHLGKVGNFAPKGIIKNQNELRYIDQGQKNNMQMSQFYQSY